MKTVIAIDDSPCTEYMLNVLIKKEWPRQAQFKIVTVIEPICASEDCKTASQAAEINDKRHLKAERLCSNVIHKIKTALPHCHIQKQVCEGSAADEILSCAQEWSADSIILGTHADDTCPHNLCGSVSRTVTKHAPCSVEIIKPKAKIKAR